MQTECLTSVSFTTFLWNSFNFMFYPSKFRVVKI